jgi:HlyD family secretion protein
MAVTAPADGVVLDRLAEPGDAVQAGRGLIGFAADGPVEVEAYPGEENLARLDVGAAARVSADAYPDDVFEGTVLWVAPSVDPSQGTVEVRLAVPEAPEYLRPGMTLSVSLEAGRADGASVLAADAVRGLGSGDPWVAVVEDGRVERRDVVVGLRGEAHVQVIDGLAPGEPVVPASEGVEPGDRVRTGGGR